MNEQNQRVSKKSAMLSEDLKTANSVNESILFLVNKMNIVHKTSQCPIFSNVRGLNGVSMSSHFKVVSKTRK